MAVVEATYWSAVVYNAEVVVKFSELPSIQNYPDLPYCIATHPGLYGLVSGLGMRLVRVWQITNLLVINHLLYSSSCPPLAIHSHGDA